MAAKVRISEKKTKTFLIFLEREYLRPKVKVSAKFRLSEKNENKFSFLSVRNLSKSSEMQNKFVIIFISEIQPITFVGLPSMKAFTFSEATSISRVLASFVAHAICGVINAFSHGKSG